MKKAHHYCVDWRLKAFVGIILFLILSDIIIFHLGFSTFSERFFYVQNVYVDKRFNNKSSPNEDLVPVTGNYFNSSEIESSEPSTKKACRHGPCSTKDCPSIVPRLSGLLKVNTKVLNLNWSVLNEQLSPGVRLGGEYLPPICQVNQTIAIIIPFRDREAHLKLFLSHMVPIFKRQLLHFRIYVIDQGTKQEKFSRGTLFNVGFDMARQDANFTCFIFHDVDLLLENDKNIYKCDATNPMHMSVAVDTMNYKLLYPTLMGGVIAVPVQTFTNVNGFSNLYWGWGGEDDDFSKRVELDNRYHIVRQQPNIARYKMIRHSHKAADVEERRFTLLQSTRYRRFRDGLNSLKYKITSYEKKPLYTHIVASIYSKDFIVDK